MSTTSDLYLTSLNEAPHPGRLKIVKPLWSIKNKEEDILNWSKDAFQALVDDSREREETKLTNLMLYRGVHYESQTESGQHVDYRGRPQRTNKMVVAELTIYVDQVVNRLASFKDSVAVTPMTNEHSDKEGAKVTKAVIDTIEYANDFAGLQRQIDRDVAIFGEQFLFILWDEFKSDIDPVWFKAKNSKVTNNGKKKTKVRISGREFLFDPDRPLRIGDIHYEIPALGEVMVDPKRSAEEVGWIMRTRWRPVEEVVWEHPEREDDIRNEATKAAVPDINTGRLVDVEEQVLVTEVWGRSDKYSANGRYIKHIPNFILINEDNPYPRMETSRWGNLPVEHQRDMALPDQLHGFSRFQILAPLQHTLNQFWTILRKNALIGSHLKIAVPTQANVHKEQLGNDSTLVHYRHPFKPEPLQTPGLPPEVFAFISQISQKMTQIEGFSEISRGEIPSNVRSGRQIRMMEELEQLRSTTRVQDRTEFRVAVQRKTKSVIGKYYKEHQERLINILGKDRMPLIESFDVSVLNKPYDFRVLPSSALPDTPGARISAAAELFQIPNFQRLLPDEQWVEIIGLGQPGKFFDAASAASAKAEWENEEYTNGRIPPEPHEGDDHIVHWRIHMMLIRSKAFLHFTDSMQEAVILDVTAHEMFMMDHATQNPSFGQLLISLPSFPAFFAPEPAPPQPVGPAPGPAPAGSEQPTNQGAPGGQPGPRPPQPANGSFRGDQEVGL